LIVRQEVCLLHSGLARGKHSSLFCLSVSDEEKSFIFFQPARQHIALLLAHEGLEFCSVSSATHLIDPSKFVSTSRSRGEREG